MSGENERTGTCVFARYRQRSGVKIKNARACFKNQVEQDLSIHRKTGEGNETDFFYE